MHRVAFREQLLLWLRNINPSLHQRQVHWKSPTEHLELPRDESSGLCTHAVSTSLRSQLKVRRANLACGLG
ncbi:hypothetical protein EYF80_011028 [Liparis tanakae]|uniref:Uncharacterized protein n=1 Tax=Liparis tanakae TaxID=230148 RepID=A0A4Z2IM98_9TELE|nr:hypothetical protein EYF80_011028 [Liparis tanakae]